MLRTTDTRIICNDALLPAAALLAELPLRAEAAVSRVNSFLPERSLAHQSSPRQAWEGGRVP
jgi:hypothetical protein